MLDQLPVFASMSPGLRELILRLVALVAALILIFLARRIVTVLAMIPLRKLNERFNTSTPERLLGIVLGPVRLVLIAVAMTVSVQLLIPSDTFFGSFVNVMSRTLITFAVLTLIYRLVDLLLPSGNQLASITGIRVEERLIPFLRVGVKLFVLAIGIVVIIQELGYDVSGLIAGIGVGGLAISLAAQDTIANLFGFASIVGDSPFSVGDYVKTPDAEGTVEHVGLRSTRLRQADQTLITLPNNKLANSPISNMSRMSKRRVDILLRLSYDTSSSQMSQLLASVRDLLDKWPSVEPESQQVFFSKFSEHALEVIVRCYIRKLTWAEMMTEQEAIQIRVMQFIEDMKLTLAPPVQSIPPGQ